MRTRSLSFLAFAVVGADALQSINNLPKVDVFVPENGFISLNIPMTARRIGSLSTRTTHPHFILSMQDIFDKVGINVSLKNPYQFKTKGEMISECNDINLLRRIVGYTVSCGKWKRKNEPCGRCVPCLIRRASLLKGGMIDGRLYSSLKNVINDEEHRDDLISTSAAVLRQKNAPGKINILASGPLPPAQLHDFRDVYFRGLSEIEDFLRSESII